MDFDFDALDGVSDSAGNTAAADFTGSTYTLDNTAPTVSDLTSLAADGTCTSGDVIDVIVQFDEIVHVTSAPQLTLETGQSDAVVSYGSGSGGDALFFQYTVAHGQGTTDLDCISISALALNGGAIRDDAGNNATLTLPAPGATDSLSASGYLKIEAMDFDGVGVSTRRSPAPIRTIPGTMETMTTHPISGMLQKTGRRQGLKTF